MTGFWRGVYAFAREACQPRNGAEGNSRAPPIPPEVNYQEEPGVAEAPSARFRERQTSRRPTAPSRRLLLGCLVGGLGGFAPRRRVSPGGTPGEEVRAGASLDAGAAAVQDARAGSAVADYQGRQWRMR
jgi:hypothetical protein